MNRVQYPAIECDDVYSACLLSVTRRNLPYKVKLQSIADVVADNWTAFDDRCSPKNFHLFVPCLPKKKEQVISRGVTKEELMDLYSVYMLKANSASRKVYDKLRAASYGLCPLCGINEATTLDHYLPKARYPLLSVNPRNLIPACQDCNKGKSDGIFTSASHQTLYPYSEDIKFYQTDWISATISSDFGILVFDFFADPPQRWLETEKNRVKNHFDNFGLRKKYSRNASQFVPTITHDIKKMLLNGNHRMVQDHYASLAEAQKKNSTFRIIYKTLAEDEDICGGSFLEF